MIETPLRYSGQSGVRGLEVGGDWSLRFPEPIGIKFYATVFALNLNVDPPKSTLMEVSGASIGKGGNPNSTIFRHLGPEVAPPTSGGVSKPGRTNRVVHDEPAVPKKREEPVATDTIVRQLVELSGNPQANLRNAAEVRKAYTPPQTPCPTVGEQAVVRRAQAVESRARAEIRRGESEAEVDPQA